MRSQLQSALSTQGLITAQNSFRAAATAAGGMTVQTMQLESATKRYTEALQKQDVTIRQAMRNRQMFNRVLKEQYQLSQASAIQWSRNSAGAATADLLIPTSTPQRLGNLRQTLSEVRGGTVSARTAFSELRLQMGLVSQVAASGAENLVKWGKNTQWAGRQLMVGLTMPVIAAGAAMGALAYKAEQQITRITKVYDFATTADQNAAKHSAEASQLRTDSFSVAANAAKQFGASMKDTLSVEAELAATGVKGNDLLSSTTEVMRLATLGEMQYQDALKTTITLQTVYGESTADLAESFNYMNAIENATSLSIQDFSQAIPKVAGPLKELGANIQDIGVLLTAMKSRGIEAKEGANAIKASFNRVLNPTRAARDMFQSLTNESLTDLIKKTKGNVIPTFQALAKATKGLEGLQRVQLFGKLFGTQQQTRLSGLVQEMENLGNTATQTGKAFQISQQNASQWAASADREMKALQESASGKFKIALESLKVSLSEAGKPFLEMGAKVLGVIGSIVEAFNSLPGPVKHFLSIGIIAGAIAGPIVMLTGLFANLLGQTMKMGASLLGLVFRFRALLPEQVASRLVAQQTESAFARETSAVVALTEALTGLNVALRNTATAQSAVSAGSRSAALLQGTAASTATIARRPGNAIDSSGNPAVYGTAPVPADRYRENSQGRTIVASTGRLVSRDEAAAVRAAERSSQNIATNAENTRRSWSQMGSSFQNVAIAAGFMGTMASDADSLMYTMSQIAIGAALIGPILIGSVAKFAGAVKTLVMPAISAIGSAASGMFGTVMSRGRTAFGAVSSATSGIVASLGGMAAIMGTVLAVSLAIGAAWYVINKNIEASRKEQENIEKSSQAWATTLGFAYTEQQKIVAEGGKNVDSLNDKMNKFKEANKDAYNDIQKFYDASEAEKWGRAIEEGVKVRLHGGTKSAAEEAVKTSLAIMGKRYSNAQFMYKLKAQIDFEDVEDIVRKRLKDVAQDMEDATNLRFDQSKSESFGRFFANPGTIQQGAGEAVRQNAREIWDIYDNTQEEEKARVFQKIAESVNSESVEIFKRYKAKYASEFKQMGIETFKDWTDYLNQNNNIGAAEANVALGEKLGLSDTEIHLVQRAGDAVKGFSKEFADYQGIPKGKATVNFGDLDALLPKINKTKISLISVKQAEEGYEAALRERGRAGLATYDIEKLAILNNHRRMAGLKEATSLEQGFSDALGRTSKALKSNAFDYSANANNIDQFINARKSAMSGTMNDVFSKAESIMNQQQQAEIDGINARSEARSDALDKAQEAMDDRFDARQKATEKRFERAQEALENKYEKKQKMFDKRWDGIMEAHDKKWETRVEREKAAFQAREDAIKKAIKTEEDAEKRRQAIFEAEKTRIQRLADLYSRNIDLTSALSSGNMDEAAKIGNDINAQVSQWQTEDAAASSQTASEKKTEDLNKQLDAIDKQRDKRLKALETQEEAEKKALEAKKEREKEALDAEKERYEKALQAQRQAAADSLTIERERASKALTEQKKALQRETTAKVNAVNRRYEIQKEALKNELEVLKAFVPKNEKELKAHIKRVEKAYSDYGVDLKRNGTGWGKTIGTALKNNVKVASASLKNDIEWAQIGKTVAEEITKGAFGLNLSEFSKWVSTGQLPKSGLNDTGKGRSPGPNEGTLPNSPLRGYHDGGYVGMGGGSRTGHAMSSMKSPSEVDTRLKVGEYVLNKNAVSKIGLSNLHKVNKGALSMDGMGGPALGLSGLIYGMAAGIIKSGVQRAIQNSGDRMMAMSADAVAGNPGKYGNITLGSEQLANASAIIGVGRSMGATQRDLVIAIMAAMQESSLRNLNYGDRDSLGLFQQRPSQGWGTPQQILNPRYAAKKFFEHLLAMKGRGKLSTSEAAQRVQRSAFPDAYAAWENMARSVVDGTGYAVSGGMMKPADGPVTSRFGWRTDPFTGARKYHDGTDISSGMGSRIRAASSGTVTFAGAAGGYGNYTIIDHGKGLRTGYAHQSNIGVSPGQIVKMGQTIGFVGSTGRSTGPHLHFQVGKNGEWVNPGMFVPGLLSGGHIKFDNTIANLHKKETVLTAPLSQKLETGINKMDSAGNSYDVTVIVEGPVSSQIDFQRGVEKALENIESRRGVRRTIGK